VVGNRLAALFAEYQTAAGSILLWRRRRNARDDRGGRGGYEAWDSSDPVHIIDFAAG